MGLSKPYVIGLVSLQVSLLLVLVASQQVRVDVVTQGAGDVRLDDGVSRVLSSSPRRDELEVVIRHDDDAGIRVLSLSSVQGSLLSDPETWRAADNFWLASEEPLEWESTGPGLLAWSGFSAGLDVRLRCSPGAGTACVSSTHAPTRCIDLSACEDEVTVEAPSDTHVHVGLMPLWRSSAHLETDAGITSIEGHFGWQPMGHVEGGEFVVTASERAGAVGGLVLNGAWLLLRGLLLLALTAVLGSALVTPVVERLGALEALLLAVFVGEAFVGNGVTALFHWLPVGPALALVVLPTLAVVARQARRGSLTAWRASLRRLDPSEPAVLRWLVPVTLLSASLAAFPAFVFPGGFVGHGFTDMADYSAWAGLAFDGPIDRTLGGVRYQDHVRVAISSVLTGGDTTAGLSLHAVRWWLVWPVLAFVFLRRLKLDAHVAGLGAVLASFSSMVVEVFTQGYVPQFDTLGFVVAGLWASLWFFDAYESDPRDLRPAYVLGAVFACSVGLYPYHAFGVMAFGVVWGAASLPVAQRARWQSTGALVLALVAVVNLNFEIILEFGASTAKHIPILNELARNIIFPWHDRREAVSILTGVEDFSRNSAMREALEGELFAGLPTLGQLASLSHRALQRLLPRFGLAWCVALVATVGWLARRRDLRGALVSLALIIPAVIILALHLRHQTYAEFKGLMTLSGLSVVPVCGLLAWLLTNGPRWRRLLVLVPVVLWCVLSLRVLWLDALGYFVGRESRALVQTRTHLMAWGPSIWQLQQWSDQLPADQRIVLVGRIHDWFRTDHDFVTYNQILTRLRRHRVWWGEDHTKHYSRNRDIDYRGAAPLDAFQWAVQFDRCAELGVPSTVELVTPLFCVRRVSER